MIPFEINQLLIGAVSALVYGVCFGMFLSILTIIHRQIFAIPICVKSIFKCRKDKPLEEVPSKRESKSTTETLLTQIIAFFKTVLFSFGFMLLSYYSLDGEIRLYMIALSLISLCASKVFLSCYIEPLLEKIINAVLRVIFSVLRFLFFPLRVIFSILSEKIPFFRKMV